PVDTTTVIVVRQKGEKAVVVNRKAGYQHYKGLLKMDLFSLCVTEEKLHKNFRNILSNGHLADRHELQRWCEGFPDRDKKFVKEFQTTFNSSFWEIYLFAFFRKIGAKFDFNHQSPDFSLELSGEKIVVE